MEIRDIFIGFTVPPSADDIGAIAGNIVGDLPSGLQKYTGKLKVQVEDFPDAVMEDEMELETPFDLLGCYQSSGPAAIGRLSGATAKRQDILYLYRRPILDCWAETGEDITRIINRVIIREIGHHFGFSANEIEMYEEDMLDTTVARAGVG